MGITHVMRGMEYLSSTPRYNYLYTALGWEIPTYIHLPTVMRDATHKLSKRDGDAYYSDYIDKGFLTEALVNYLALVGWNPGTDREFFTLPELVEAFDIHRINNSPGIFDVNKLEWMNSQYVAKMDFDRYLAMATPWFDKILAGKGMDYRRLAELMQSRTDIFSRIPEKIAFLAEMPDYDTAIFCNKKQKSDETVAKEVLPLLLPVLEGISDWTEQNIHDVVMEKIQEWGRKNGSVLWPMRISISGQESTPGGAFEIAYLLGKSETLRRMKASLARLG
jgi:glutamyl-tRNA synthetase